MKYLRDIPSWRSSWGYARRLMSRYQVGRPQLTNCILVSRTGDSWLNSENECTSCQFGVEVQDKRNFDPKWQDGAFIGIRDRSDEMLIMTTSGVYKTRNVRRRPELERWDFEFLMTLNGMPWNPNPAVGEMAADALPADMAVPPQVVVAAAPVDRAASRLYIRRNCPGCRLVMTGTTARAHTEECRKRLESCLAEDGQSFELYLVGESSRINR